MKHSASRIFRVPTIIGIATTAALLVALLGDGWHDMLAWVGLALPMAAIGYGLARRNA